MPAGRLRSNNDGKLVCSSLCASLPDEDALPSGLRWYHAVNSIEVVDKMLEDIRLDARGWQDRNRSYPVSRRHPVDYFVFAVEIDVHCVKSPHHADKFTAVARHDAEPVPEGQEEVTLARLLDYIGKELLRTASSHNHIFLEVIKLDLKTPRAMETVYRYLQDAASLTVRQYFSELPSHRWWFNADVVRGPIVADDAATASVSAVVTAPCTSNSNNNNNISNDAARQGLPLHALSELDPFSALAYTELVVWLVRIGQQSKYGLSLGWTTKADQFRCYGDVEMAGMLQLLTDMGGGPLPLLTFPVRYSLVFPPPPTATTTDVERCADGEADGDDDRGGGGGGVGPLRRLVLGVCSLGIATNVHCTFWRGRTESIEAGDVTRILQCFPTATIDLN